MSIEDYITEEVEEHGLMIRATQHIDIHGYAKEVADEVDERILHVIATQKGYVKECTCHMELIPTGEDVGTYHCDNCHAESAGIWCEDGGTCEPLYCPHCRAKVVGK